MTSLEIAELTGKQHSHVKRDIRLMMVGLPNEFHPKLDNIRSGGRGRPAEHYCLNKDLTLTLISGYDMAMRYKIVKRWQQLEGIVRLDLSFLNKPNLPNR
ncbi:Rha family transcriptional regulator [Shewanella aquimarina]|uniref:Rha family transcriptional regulator n=1 Tax=Shewanella aquimarina TaxID=260365 RepID=UPI002014B395|nr:Rha family transcriptional regulator [Shewanella aquimarina]MCL2908547.1 Rha family transcriptional regulator [Shewanella aquimarina]